MTWLQAAAKSAEDPSDRRQAQNDLDIITGAVGEAQGPRATLGRPALNALANLRWFAPFGMAVAARFVWRALTQVARYLTDDQIRSYAQDQVLHLIGPDTRLVIGHSLGSVVAYEAVHRYRPPPHPHHPRIAAGTAKRRLRTAAPPTPTRARSGHPVGKPRRRRRPRRRPPRPCALLPTRTRIHRHPADPHRRHRLQTPRHHRTTSPNPPPGASSPKHSQDCRLTRAGAVSHTTQGCTPAKSTRSIIIRSTSRSQRAMSRTHRQTGSETSTVGQETRQRDLPE